MDNRYYLLLTLKTGNGFESFAKFWLGNDRDLADEIFSKLKGEIEVTEQQILFIDFMETREGLPVNLKMIACNLEQLAENCKSITKELFRVNNLDADNGNRL